MTRDFTKAELLSLTRITRPNHAYLSREGLLTPSNRVTRGVSPRYDLDEVLRAYLLETLRAAAGMEYAAGALSVDRIRETNPSFWRSLRSLRSQDEAWLSLFDGETLDLDIQRAEAESPPVSLWRIADPQERRKHKTVVVVRITNDVLHILATASSG